jgi:hypothetical protein
VKIKTVVLYSCNSDSDGYKVTKFIDEVYNTHYHVINNEQQVYCDCLGFTNRSSCRHLKITDRFKKEGKVDKGYLFNLDTGEFTKLEGTETEEI